MEKRDNGTISKAFRDYYHGCIRLNRKWFAVSDEKAIEVIKRQCDRMVANTEETS